DEQGRLHRARRDVERLEQERADDERNDRRLDQHPPHFGEAALLAPLLGRNGHGFLIHWVSRLVPRRFQSSWTIMCAKSVPDRANSISLTCRNPTPRPFYPLDLTGATNRG